MPTVEADDATTNLDGLQFGNIITHEEMKEMYADFVKVQKSDQTGD